MVNGRMGACCMANGCMACNVVNASHFSVLDGAVVHGVWHVLMSLSLLSLGTWNNGSVCQQFRRLFILRASLCLLKA